MGTNLSSRYSLPLLHTCVFNVCVPVCLHQLSLSTVGYVYSLHFCACFSLLQVCVCVCLLSPP